LHGDGLEACTSERKAKPGMEGRNCVNLAEGFMN
jgi:hypothetical protein